MVTDTRIILYILHIAGIALWSALCTSTARTMDFQEHILEGQNILGTMYCKDGILEGTSTACTMHCKDHILQRQFTAGKKYCKVPVLH
jgi:hypothetical protein